MKFLNFPCGLELTAVSVGVLSLNNKSSSARHQQKKKDFGKGYWIPFKISGKKGESVLAAIQIETKSEAKSEYHCSDTASFFLRLCFTEVLGLQQN